MMTGISEASHECDYKFLYLFQVYSAILWCTEEYYIYAAIILFMALVTCSISLWEIRSNLVNIRQLARLVVKLQVVRGEEEIEVDSTDLVPGDVVVIHPGVTLPCGIQI